eukprot:CAMPEP_0117467214 /NCGR_PEP_ID=MMETSP0784-20121206/5539_1 /TAXON_ID=39447 /ORGANISM="" /LENGTH=163 /DNA_ID=CAMNT_0005261173 /DNA_START=177 /DNA_END=668 /DNA_ORIENTATION=+
MARVVVRLPPFQGHQLKELLAWEGVMDEAGTEKLFRAVCALREALGVERLDQTLGAVDVAFRLGVCAAQHSRDSVATISALGSSAMEMVSDFGVRAAQTASNLGHDVSMFDLFHMVGAGAFAHVLASMQLVSPAAPPAALPPRETSPPSTRRSTAPSEVNDFL